MKIESVKIESIKLNPANPRTIKDEKFAQLVRSVRDFPEMLEIRPIVVNNKMEVLGGNMRLRACIEAGMKEIPIIRAENLTDNQQREFIIKDNVGFGEWDWGALANEWDSMELADWGLDVPDFAGFGGGEAQEDNYEIPDEIKTDIVCGDLFEIGPHRLLCGDSTNAEDVGRLMDGAKAHLCFTSPPYNAGKSEALSGNTHTTDNKYNEYDDNKSQSIYLDMLIGFTDLAINNSVYLICNLQMLAGNKIAIIDYLHKYKNNFIDVAIWDKGHAAPQMADNVMSSTWEYLFFISSKKNATRAIPNGGFRGNVPNIHRGGPQRNNDFSSVHAATFPIHLPEWALQFTKEKEIILDPFLGSGTTMVAAHQLNRKCYGMEIDPKYCQVIVGRMIKLDTNIEIKKNGQPYFVAENIEI